MERYDHQTEDPTPYNQFGRWVRALNKVFDVTLPEIAMRIDYNKGSFSVATRGNGGSLSRQAFTELLKEYKALAEERQIAMPETALFLNLAWLGEDVSNLDIATLQAAEKALKHIEWLGETMEELRRLRKENERFKSLRNRREMLTAIAQLEQDKEELQRHVAWLKLQQREAGDS